MPRIDTAHHPTPRGEALTCVKGALITPHTASGRSCVVDRNGAPVVDALTVRKDGMHEMHFVDRTQVKPTQRLPGRYLYAGEYWSHFGHFLFESLSRLWALDLTGAQLDGLIFVSSRGSESINPDGMHAQILAALCVDLPVIFVNQPTEIEDLIVPRQGLSLGPLAAGTPAVRRFFQDRFRSVTPRQGVEKLYISRTGYRMRRGGLIAEEVIQARLAEAGYVAYSPEKHPIEHQIATYLGAKQIIAPDSSALHLFGFVGRAEQDLAIVLRRLDGAADMMPQITGFTGRKPHVIDSIRRIWSRDNARIPTWSHFAELDMQDLGQKLVSAGFINDPNPWLPTTRRQLTRIQTDIQRRFACTVSITPVQRD